MASSNNDARASHNLRESLILTFLNGNWSPEESMQRIGSLLTNKELGSMLLRLTPQDQRRFIDEADKAYPTLDRQSARYITALGDACSTTLQLPSSAIYPTEAEKRGDTAEDLSGCPVATEASRIHTVDRQKGVEEIIFKRVTRWGRLDHPNLQRLRGVKMTPTQLHLAYESEGVGTLAEYLSLHPNTSRSSLLLDVAKGLEYLHSLQIPHGDLRSANVVVDRSGRARLTDYGLAPITSDPSFTIAATPGSIGTSRWLAPEIITPTRKGRVMPMVESKPADVFAFGMLAVELFTGRIPFEQQRNETAVLRISQGGRPEIPRNAQALGITPGIWNLLESCLQENPKKRPAMEEVVRRLEAIQPRDPRKSPAGSHPNTSSGCDPRARGLRNTARDGTRPGKMVLTM